MGLDREETLAGTVSPSDGDRLLLCLEERFGALMGRLL